MRWRLALLALATAASAVSAQPRALGVYGSWAAFRDAERCYAITEPHQSPAPEESRPFLAVGHWPRQRAQGQMHVRLSREKRPGSAVLVRIDGRSHQLSGGGRDAWAPNERADREIRAAMRTGLNLVVETRSIEGRLIRDHYRLRGAASAMDAAALACLPAGR